MVAALVVDIERDWVDYATLVATWFAAIGTVTAVGVALKQSRDARTKSIVARTVMTSGNRLRVIVHNEGPRAVTVRDVLYRTKDGEVTHRGWQGRDLTGEEREPLPKFLLEGESVEISMPRIEDAHYIQIVDTAGDSFYSYANPFLSGVRVRRVPGKRPSKTTLSQRLQGRVRWLRRS